MPLAPSVAALYSSAPEHRSTRSAFSPPKATGRQGVLAGWTTQAPSQPLDAATFVEPVEARQCEHHVAGDVILQADRTLASVGGRVSHLLLRDLVRRQRAQGQRHAHVALHVALAIVLLPTDVHLVD